jgi:hypothetical protein
MADRIVRQSTPREYVIPDATRLLALGGERKRPGRFLLAFRAEVGYTAIMVKKTPTRPLP